MLATDVKDQTGISFYSLPSWLVACGVHTHMECCTSRLKAFSVKQDKSLEWIVKQFYDHKHKGLSKSNSQLTNLLKIAFKWKIF